ncbi:MAG: hypothetical protein R2784_11130 [Saprospiraceae bacterium]
MIGWLNFGKGKNRLVEPPSMAALPGEKSNDSMAAISKAYYLKRQ